MKHNNLADQSIIWRRFFYDSPENDWDIILCFNLWRKNNLTVRFCKNSHGKITRQALCITHLPQVACYAQNHFVVSKELKNNKTVTKIIQANKDEKINEILKKWMKLLKLLNFLTLC